MRGASAVLGAALLPPSARAVESVALGTVGQGSAANWPTYIALSKKLFEAANLVPDIVYTPSNAALVQQVAAGSLDMALSSGLVDPLRAIDKGAPVAIVGLEMQSPPYALLAKPSIPNLAGLKGKIIVALKKLVRPFVRLYTDHLLNRQAQVNLYFAHLLHNNVRETARLQVELQALRHRCEALEREKEERPPR